MNRPNNKTKKIIFIILASVIIFVAFYLRATGLFDFYHTDERAVMKPVVKMSKQYSFDPDYYARPNHISIYLNFVVQNIYSVVKYKNFLANTYDSHISEYFAVARAINAVIGTLIIFLAYYIGKEFSRKIAVYFALLFSFFPIFIDHSHLITPDITTVFISLIMILTTVKLVKSFSMKQMIFLCLLCSLNIIEKYPGLLSIVLVYYVLGVQRYKENGLIKWKNLTLDWIKYTGLIVFFCYLVSPSLFIHPKHTLGALLSESGGHLGADGLGLFGNLSFYAYHFFINAGIFSIFFFVSGFLYINKNRNYLIIIPLFYGFFYWIIMSILKLHWVRWGMPMYISPLFMIGFGIDYLLNRHYFRRIIPILMFVSFSNMIVISVFETIKYHLNSTVAVGKDFTKENNIIKENTIYEGYTPFYEYGPNKKLDWFDKKNNSQYKYVIISSSMKDRYIAEPERKPDRVKAYKEIEKLTLINQINPASRPVQTFSEITNFRAILPYILEVKNNNYSGFLKGPIIWIYKK